MKKYVIYSAIVGAYDEIMQPLVIDERFDYILFSNDISEERIGVWQICRIAYYNEDSTRICRYIKTHPEELLPGYLFSIWMDSNVQITSRFVYDQSVALYNREVLFASMWHPVRDCIYGEAFAVMNMMVEHESVVLDWCHKLRREHYPVHIGLFETGVTYRKHCAQIAAVDKDWWNCIVKYSRRDQLSCNYCIWKHQIPFVYFAGNGNNARNMPDFNLIMHKDIKHNHCAIGKNEAWLMRYCWKDKSKTAEIEKKYYTLYSLPFPKFAAFICGQYYRIKYLLNHVGRK